MTEETRTCFVAMPVTTPPEHVDDYGGDRDHFTHVLEHLFVPAIEAAGFTAVRPTTTGADVIQAEIIRNLETADLVLVDLSRHNPNVFFELGVRTSLDKPVCLVRDTFTPKLPFDTSIINTHTYNADLLAWHVEGQVPLLTAHLRASDGRSDGSNPLWKYFGLTRRASPDTVEGDPVEAKLDAVLQLLDRQTAPLQALIDPGQVYFPEPAHPRAVPEKAIPVPGEPGDPLPPNLDSRLAKVLLELAESIFAQCHHHIWLLGVRTSQTVELGHLPGLPEDTYELGRLRLRLHGFDSNWLPLPYPF
ncbi:hypothetical protein [Serinicoccus marinus]|uniref:hypothetical protein n=1 Tax=Serinicoccus marinus TaxID=247333 RepID=UPI0024930B33|nr:hypothetical protein [Serinicoccus marinus]